MVDIGDFDKVGAVIERVLSDLPTSSSNDPRERGDGSSSDRDVVLALLRELRDRMTEVERLLGAGVPVEEVVPVAPKTLLDIAAIPTQRRSELVFAALEQMILSEEVSPGDRLPSERELAERFGVGRNSIREAIRQLSLLGLVEAYQGGGTFVLEASTAGLVRPFRNVIRFGGATADKVFEFRLIFEPTVAALAAMRCNEPARSRLEASLASFENAIRERDDRAAAFDSEFHHMVAEATGNPVIAAVESALMEFLHSYRREALERAAYQPSDRAVAGHREVYEAIAAGDPDEAADAMREHLRATIIHVRRVTVDHAPPDAV